MDLDRKLGALACYGGSDIWGFDDSRKVKIEIRSSGVSSRGRLMVVELIS